MATMLLQNAGAMIGGALGGQIGSSLGGLAGQLGGALIDRRLFGSGTSGPQLKTIAGLSSTEGAAIPRLYGRVRVGGQVIWTTRFEETVTVQRSGALGGKGAALGGSSKATTYNYFANLAVGLCEGPITEVRRIWADGSELDLTLLTLRIYPGSATQAPDALIIAKEGADNAPAYKGFAYVVFERLPLSDYGNRIPQLSFEVVRAIHSPGPMIRGIDIIPGATEYGYGTTALSQSPSPGVTVSENRHQLVAGSDWTASLDAVQALCPNLSSVALTVAWFGDDLRAGQCSIALRVEDATKVVPGNAWSVAGLSRALARVVSQVNGAPAYGGTPADSIVPSAIADLKARGLSVVFYPFVMMDIAAGNANPDPWSGSASQPSFPWRGRITCDPAPDIAGTADGTSAAAAQVASFFGSPSPAPDEWSYRRFILHCAQLCAAAGGVDAFLLGSELRGLTRLRDDADRYPAALALAQLATDVRAILGPHVKISYAADWTEYGAQARDGGADVDFPLDVVWASPDVDFIGLDAYFPLSDWRDGTGHLDAAVAPSIYDRDYLRARVGSGEAYDWYYADDAARAAQIRTPITDGACGKPWMFRAKDLAGWWSNPHVERRQGMEKTRATPFVPMAKPVWLTEIGCPAVDRGANAPNVFVDAKSSESGLPPFSRGYRDDLMQARALEAMIVRFDPAAPGHVAADNPLSPVYGGPMVDPARIHVWAWDARPFPAFPAFGSVWSDAANWETGHWLNGRLETAPLDDLVSRIVGDLVPDAPPLDVSTLNGGLDGYALDRLTSVRSAVEPLATVFGFAAVASAPGIRFASLDSACAMSLGEDDIVPDPAGNAVQRQRAQESELPREMALGFSDGEFDYRSASVTSRQLVGTFSRKAEVDLAMVMSRPQAQRLADVCLQSLWTQREIIDVAVRPGLLALEAGDLVTLADDGDACLYRIDRISDGAERKLTATLVEPSIYDARPARRAPRLWPQPLLPGKPQVTVLDLAIAPDDPAPLQYLAVFADPWPGPMALWRSQAGGFSCERLLARAAIVGSTLDPLAAGPLGLFDLSNSLRVSVSGGALSSLDDVSVLGGANLAAIGGPDGAWEIIGFSLADLVAPGTYRLSRLLRGLGGEDMLAARNLASGAPFVLLDEAVVALATGVSSLGVAQVWRVGPASRDFADASVIEFTAMPGPKALMPLSPVRATATRTAAGVVVSFVRRGRREADAWEPLDIPLGEDSETYGLDILRAGAVVRQLNGTAPSILYPAAAELSDFGAPQSSLAIALRQMSARVGAGFVRQATLTVR